jgi:hypothetical protein
MERLGDLARSQAASPQQLTTSSSALSEAKKLAAYHAKLILGCYRVGDANDPEIYVAAVAALLSRYPSDIGTRLSDPKDGIAGRIKWLPSVSEIREECDRLQAADVAAAKRRADVAEQFRLRQERTPAPSAPDPYNVFVPTFAPQYRAMVERGGRPGVSLEDKTRGGVWVPHSWLLGQSRREPWQPFTDDELRARYPRPPAKAAG